MSSAVVAYVNERVLHTAVNTPIDETCRRLRQLLATRESAMHDVQVWQALEPLLLHMAAVYLCTEKHRGWVLNKVANFHIRNGACVWRVNVDGDTSPRGWTSSYSLMAHYRYSLERLQQNTELYAHEKRVDIGHKVQVMLDFAELLDIYDGMKTTSK